jgi:hypothetical protein
MAKTEPFSFARPHQSLGFRRRSLLRPRKPPALSPTGPPPRPRRAGCPPGRARVCSCIRKLQQVRGPTSAKGNPRLGRRSQANSLLDGTALEATQLCCIIGGLSWLYRWLLTPEMYSIQWWAIRRIVIRRFVKRATAQNRR